MRLRRIASALWIGVATIVAHQAAYRLSYSDPHARAHALEASGHGWTAYLLPVLAAAILGATLTSVVDARRRRGGNARSTGTLAAGGVAAFLAVELTERLLHTGSVTETLHNLSGISGILPLVVGALFVTATAPLFALARRAIEALATKTTALRHARTPHHRPRHELVRPARLIERAPSRGPPLTALG